MFTVKYWTTDEKWLKVVWNKENNGKSNWQQMLAYKLVCRYLGYVGRSLLMMLYEVRSDDCRGAKTA